MSAHLTTREQEIVRLVGHDGLSYAECARALGISTYTVLSHIRRIAAKLDPEQKPRDAIERHAATLPT